MNRFIQSGLKLLFTGSMLALLGCQAEPGVKNIPFAPVKKADKKLDDIFIDAKIDILFIVDDSGSMSSFQDRLAQNAQLFIDRFFQTKFIDYHIGVTTSSLNDFGSVADGGRLNVVSGLNHVDRNTPDGNRILAQMMRVGTGGSVTEQFFSIHMQALSQSLTLGSNSGFYRESANLAIFVLTDTEDQSGRGVQEAYDFLLNLKNGREEKLNYVAAIIENPTPGCRGESQPPFKIRALADLHKDRGYVFSLCKNDYGIDMAKIAEDLVRAVSTVYLDQLPDVRTITVTYGDMVIPNDPDTGWVYSPEENAIFLSPNIDLEESDKADLKVNFEAIYK